MTEEWTDQASFKTPGGTLVNVRAQSPEELAVKLTAYAISDLAVVIANAEAKISGSAAVTHAVGKVEYVPGPNFQPQATVAPTYGAPRIPPCPHGQRNKVSGKSAKGPWTAFFCASEKGTPGQCDPVFKNSDNKDQWDW